ncbi:trace amine-associated receptor 4-like protein [Lates japonicus]|uniref:Trace amine-associated receptor 4-like protein n=1 Tax=Lates japonicus TaxID=270547 RepID=A0AAD3NBI0_LATJO|nr:trace amine-associated receptor 4-like protein [Lates japonicus]
MMEEDELCFPQLLNTSCKKPKPPRSEAVLIYTLLFFISVLTAALNLLVIISISHYRELHSPTNLILLSLAVSDFFVGLLVIPIETLKTGFCWVLGDLMCALYFLIPYIPITASAFNMVLISVDRYVAICDPMHYSTRITDKVINISVCLCWTFSVFYSIFLSYDHLKQPGRYNSCYGECLVNVAGDVDLVVAFIIPITIIVTLYMRVFVVAVSQARAMRSHVAAVTVQNSMPLMTMKSELKAARTLGIVVAVFLICYSPYYCLTLTGGNILIGSPIEAFMSFLMYFNSCLNPVIYAFFYPWFRKAVKHIVSLQILRPDSSETNIL